MWMYKIPTIRRFLKLLGHTKDTFRLGAVLALVASLLSYRGLMLIRCLPQIDRTVDQAFWV
jgi:hypothetical protein